MLRFPRRLALLLGALAALLASAALASAARAADRVYWANVNGDKISFANLDGGGGGDLSTAGATVSVPRGVAIDPAAGRIYWANFGANTISFANLDGSGGGGDLSTAGATVDGPRGVAIDPAAGRIYWANYGGNGISFANLNGSGGGGDLSTAGATVNGPGGVAIDPAAGRIYWANFSGISFANLDGSGGGGDLSTAGATTNGANFPALLEAPAGAGAPVITGGSKLSCSQGSWAPDLLGSFLYRAPQSFAYHWSLSGTDIADATQSSFTARAGGNYRCRVTAQNQAGATAQTSAPQIEFRLKCPKSAKPSGCRFRLQAFTKKHKGKAETVVSKAKLKPGKSKALSLKPKPRFAAKLASGKSVLVRETVTIKGTTKTVFRKLKLTH